MRLWHVYNCIINCNWLCVLSAPTCLDDEFGTLIAGEQSHIHGAAFHISIRARVHYGIQLSMAHCGTWHWDNPQWVHEIHILSIMSLKAGVKNNKKYKTLWTAKHILFICICKIWKETGQNSVEFSVLMHCSYPRKTKSSRHRCLVHWKHCSRERSLDEYTQYHQKILGNDTLYTSQSVIGHQHFT